MSTEEGKMEQSDDSSEDENGVSLGEILNLPEGHLEALSAVEGMDEFLLKIKEYVENKEAQVEDYQSTMREFEENLETRDNEISKLKQ